MYGSRKCPVSDVFDHTVYSFLLLSNFAYLATKIDLYLDSTEGVQLLAVGYAEM